MLRIPTKPFTDNQIEYYSYINYSYYNDRLIEEDRILDSIDYHLPTREEYFYRKIKYRALMKPWKYLRDWRNLMKLKYLKGGVDVSEL